MKEFFHSREMLIKTEIVVATAGELAYGISHLGRSLQQHREKNVSRGQAFLHVTQVALPDSNPYFSKNEILAAHPVSSGFHTAVYSFTSSKGEWVIKVGMKEAALAGSHPSSQEYTIWYASGLDIQREIFTPKLPYLIPEPQSVLHVKTDQEGGSTIILQPFIHGISQLSQIGTLKQEEQERLKEEMKILRQCCRDMEKRYALRLDFFRANTHFVISKKDNEQHLTFLDNGLLEKERTPLFYLINRAAESILLR